MMKKLFSNKKGAAMIWAITFSLVIFVIIALLFSIFLASFSSLKQNKSLSEQIVLNQIGEYYLRAVASGGKFPEGQAREDTSTPEKFDVDGYGWMDQDIKDFFHEIDEKYQYSFPCKEITSKGNFWSFYQDASVVTQVKVTRPDASTALSVTLGENIEYENESGIFFRFCSDPKSNFEILEWTTEPGDYGDSTELGFFKKIWRKIGGFVGNLFYNTDINEQGKSYTVVYDANGGTLAKTQDTAVPENCSIYLPVPTHPDGKAFDGWYTKKDGGEKIDSKYYPTADITLYAHWTDATTQ